jgi:hypothetical protein
LTKDYDLFNTSTLSTNTSGTNPLDRSLIVIGSSNYHKIIESSAFVDKTMLIKDLVESKNEISLITCPRRFGKSTNMNMVKTFLQLEVDKNGNEVTDVVKTDNYKVFVNQIKGKSLKIMGEKDFVNKHLAKHPVIFVDFLSAKGLDYQGIVSGIKESISEAFESHKYMIRVFERTLSSDVDSLEKQEAQDKLDTFNRLYRKRAEEASEDEIKYSLKFLSKVLYDHFAKKVFVLIDEYDTPIYSALLNNIDVKKINSLIDGILCSVFKTCGDFLEMGLMTGISEMIRCSAHSGLNNIKTFKFLCDHKYSKYYGFTEDEVLTLLDDFDVKYRAKVKRWYNGYFVEKSCLRIYNPWSIILFIESDNIQNYWNESGAIKNLSKLFLIDEIRIRIIKLLNHEDVKIDLCNRIDIEQFENLQKMLNCKHDVPGAQINLFFSYLYELGYLNFTAIEGVFKIPNKEIEAEFMEKMVNYYIETYKLKESHIKDAIKKLDFLLENSGMDGTADFKNALSKLILPLNLTKIEAYEEDGIHPNEDLFHSILNYIALQSKASKFGTEVCYNRLARSDIIIINQTNKLGMVIELKFNGCVDKALNQTLKYLGIFKNHDVNIIKRVGINISKDKNVDMKIEIEMLD